MYGERPGIFASKIDAGLAAIVRVLLNVLEGEVDAGGDITWFYFKASARSW